jgi:hypothetical protein
MLITPFRAISDHNLLGRGFTGPTWNRHKAMLKAAYGEPLTHIEYSLFRPVAERRPPSKPVKELWYIAGRRAGKDSIASAIATTMAMGDYSQFLRPGEMATIACLANGKLQAKIVLNYIKAAFLQNPLLSPLVTHETEYGLELSSNIEILVLAANYRSLRGRTLLAVILDEVALWRSEESANPDIETYTAVVPSLVTIPTSMLIGITTAYRRAGLAFDKFKHHYGQDDPDILVIKGTTRQFNPTIPQSFIDQQVDRDPEAASAEWLSEWRSDLADFVSREIVEDAVVEGCHELPRQNSTHYVGFVDPSGGSADSMTLAIAHKEGDKTILDCLREVKPPFQPELVTEEFCETLRQYKVTRIHGDRYAGEWPREQFKKRNIVYLPAETSKTDIYRDVLPLLNSRKISLLDNPRLINQLSNLERRTSRGTGRDIVDHPPGQHDDLANAACGALSFANRRQPTIIDPTVLLRSAQIGLNNGYHGPALGWDNGYAYNNRF